MAELAIEVRVTGLVQGVSFRYYTREEALAQGLRGWVRNLPDGSVAAWLQGEAGAVDQVRGWLLNGPPQARVIEVKVEPRTPDPALGEFEIRR